LAPHDLSIWRAVGGAPIRQVAIRAIERRPSRGALESIEVALLAAELENGLVCHIELSRVHAFKERRFVVVGENAVAVFDDAARPPSLTIHRPPSSARRPAGREFSTFAEFIEASGWPGPHAGERVAVPAEQPLTRELGHFLACARGEASPHTPFAEGA